MIASAWIGFTAGKVGINSNQRLAGTLIEYLDQGKLRCALALREQSGVVTVLDQGGRQRQIKRELVFIVHGERKVEPQGVGAALAALSAARAEFASELDLNLLWEVTREQNRGFSAGELAELYFGRRSTVAEAVVLEALLGDQIYFKRRYFEFLPQDAERVERTLLQQQRNRLRSEANQRLQGAIRQLLAGEPLSEHDARDSLKGELSRFLENPSTRSRELSAMLTQALADVDPVETAFELLERLDAKPAAPRFVAVGGLPLEFSAGILTAASQSKATERPPVANGVVVAIDDEETQEVDDALSCELLPDGSYRVRVFIALVADWVEKGGVLDREAAQRGATVYLPEATIRMLPDEISCNRASLLAGVPRATLVTEAHLDPAGELLDASLYPAAAVVTKRLTYDEADLILAADERQAGGDEALATMLRQLNALALQLRERRRRAGAVLVQRRELKVKVRDGTIDVRGVDAGAPARQMVAEFMLLSNFVAARFAADRHLAIIYRVQPNFGSELVAQRPRLSLYPDLHVGVGLKVYAQLSSPIRRYADLALQRQLIAALAFEGGAAYRSDELMEVLANAESAELGAKELERRAKRYWALRFLEESRADQPLLARALRAGTGAELSEFPLRGSLRGAPPSIGEIPILVAVAKIDPLRGHLAFDYLGPAASPDR
jgi:exoribonuclease-2